LQEGCFRKIGFAQICLRNSAFYAKLGCAVKSNDVNELTELCISLVQDENRCNSLANAAKTCRLQNASECIYSTLKEV